MSDSQFDRQIFLITISLFALYILSQLFGDILFPNSWSFRLWEKWTLFSMIGSLLVAGMFTFALVRYHEAIATFFNRRYRMAGGLVLLFIVLLVAQFDSFLFGAGNLRIAQIGQVDTVFPRWYEYGSVFVVSLFDTCYSLFDLHYNTAAVLSWKTFSFVCVLLTLIATLQISRLLSDNRVHRFVLFLILFFGPHALLQFGFIGVEPVIMAGTCWFALFALQARQRFQVRQVLPMWLVLAVGVVLHHTLIYLLPAALFVTLAGKQGSSSRTRIAVGCGLATWVVLTVVAYQYAHGDFEYQQFLLFWNGKLPHANYGIVSAGHLGDFGQLLFLVFPQILVVAYLLWKRRVNNDKSKVLPVVLIMSLGGLTAALMIDPANSIVLDAPRLTAWLVPLALLFAALLAEAGRQGFVTARTLALTAAFSIVIVLLYVPSFVRIAKADPYVETYLQKHDAYYRTACLSFRDAYFYRKELSKADNWEWRLPRVSDDYLNLKGIRELSLVDQDADALVTLYKVIVRNPYWADARAVFASIQLKLGHPDLAKPQIDTALMLEPYNAVHWRNLYSYYRDHAELFKALEVIIEAEHLFPSDNEIVTDEMIIHYRLRDYTKALALAEQLVALDAKLPYPYFIRGLIADARFDTTQAEAQYQQFIRLNPDGPDVPQAQERLSKLRSDAP